MNFSSTFFHHTGSLATFILMIQVSSLREFYGECSGEFFILITIYLFCIVCSS